MSKMFDILRAMDAYIGNDSGNDGDVICAECGEIVPQELVAECRASGLADSEIICEACAYIPDDKPGYHEFFK